MIIELIKKMMKMNKKFIAYEIPEEESREKYCKHFIFVKEDFFYNFFF